MTTLDIAVLSPIFSQSGDEVDTGVKGSRATTDNIRVPPSLCLNVLSSPFLKGTMPFEALVYTFDITCHMFLNYNSAVK